jgi:hypothetical protein
MATSFTPSKLLFREEAVTLEEIKFKSATKRSEVVHDSIEAESKDMLEPQRMKAIENLHAYQVKMKAWRDKKIKEKTFEVSDLVLL